MLKEDKKEVGLQFNLPQFKKEDIKIDLSKNFIIIKAERKTDIKVQRKDFFHDEKSSHIFNYKTNVPSIDYKKAKIIFNKGILTIKAPKI